MGHLVLPVRIFIALLIAVVPTTAMVVAADTFGGSPFGDAHAGVLFLTGAVFALAWIGLLTLVYARLLASEFQTLITLARRGKTAQPTPGDEPTEAQARLVRLLDERNQRVAELAAEASAAPISEDPVRVAAHVVASTRQITGDQTWMLAIIRNTLDELLPTGVHDGTAAEPRPIEEVHRWAAVSEVDDTVPGPHVSEGAWGAFAVIPVSTRVDLTAILYAPWEGRAPLSAADQSLLGLVGQHAGTTLEHALLYARVRIQAEAIERMANLQRDFLRGVTHDLQTPLTSIRALASELQTRPTLRDDAREDLDMIAFQADRLRRMVAQLLIASRLEAGAVQPQQDVFAVQPIIERTWTAMRGDRPFEVTLDGPPHLAVADPDRFEQVVWAVLDNAVKYSPDGSPIEVVIGAAGAVLRLVVHDHGTGMDAETRARAFDQFYRSDHARKLAPDGSGVGLYAARGLMQAMGGDIDISSELGRGTSITLSLIAESATSAD